MKKNEKKNSDSFPERVKSLCDMLGGISEAARATGISVTAINKYRNGLSDPSRSNLIALADAAGVDVGWLATGEQKKDIGIIESNGSNYVSIPVMNVEASAGNGSIVPSYEEATDMMHLNEAWLRTAFHVTPNSVTMLPIKGDSMEPTLRSGELVLVEKIDPAIRPSDGIYVIRIDGAIAVKRLQFLPNKHVKVFSDNKVFEPYEITPDDITDFTILGRVIAGFRAL